MSLHVQLHLALIQQIFQNKFNLFTICLTSVGFKIVFKVICLIMVLVLCCGGVFFKTDSVFFISLEFWS